MARYTSRGGSVEPRGPGLEGLEDVHGGPLTPQAEEILKKEEEEAAAAGKADDFREQHRRRRRPCAALGRNRY